VAENAVGPSHADYPMAVAAESASRKTKRRKYSHHRCPRCGKEALERKRLPFYLRPLRVVPGLNPRRYVCDECTRNVTLWKPPRN